MKVKNFIKSVNRALSFVDIFGDNLGGNKLNELISFSHDKTSISISNAYGTVKTFNKEELNAICDEIANCLESFKPLYPGFVRVHSAKQGNKYLITLMSKIFLSGSRSFRSKTATISISGKDIEILFELTETHTEIIS
jgi:hypothetical protein